jgi:predicted nucleic acid-binding Zn ribbon protein
MIKKQDLNKNWSDLSSVLFESLPESLQDDHQEWLSYHWNLVVGKEIAYISNVDKIAKDILHIRVQGTEWLPVLENFKKKIIQEINNRAGKNLLKNIKFKI